MSAVAASREPAPSIEMASPYFVREAASIQAVVAEAEAPQETGMHRVYLDGLVKELVASMKTMTAVDRTETTVQLRYPPIFQGVSLVVTEFQSAKKEFNLTFYNLTNPEARFLIETVHNQEGLRLSLAEKGYNLQMITIEPKLEATVATVELEQADSRRDDGRSSSNDDHPRQQS